MLKHWQSIVLNVLGLLTIALAVANGALFISNRDAQQKVNGQQIYLQQSTSLEGLYRDIAKALAELAVKGNDTQVLDMLKAQGLSVNAAPATAVPPPVSGPPASPVRR